MSALAALPADLPAALPTIDIGRIPSGFWLAAVAGAFSGLSEGRSVEFSADEDPVAAWHLLEALLPGTYSWTYLETGPERWRVRVGRG